MRWQDVNKELLAMRVGGIGVAGLFAMLFLLGGVDYEFSGDSVCNQLECEAYINVTTSYWAICFDHPPDSQTHYAEIEGFSKLQKTTIGETPAVVYKKSTRGRTLWVNLNEVDQVIKTAPPEIPVDWLVPTTKSRATHSDEVGHWRPVKDDDCWDRGKVNKIKLIGHPERGQRIKWSFVVNEYVDIDPAWISWDYIYENLSRNVSVYEYIFVQVNSTYIPENDTWTVPHNYTYQNFTGYGLEYYNGDIIGITAGDIEYYGEVNLEGDYIYVWDYDQADRNLVEFGTCRDFEADKEVCEEIYLINES